jgi:4-amino-4-deoxy-L-arabinose transferase-like glycosyltransferase
VTRRELLLLVPLLALYVAAWAFFPDRPDDEASYVALAHRLADGWYVTGDDNALLDARPDSPDLWFGPGLPGVLAPLALVDAPVWAMRLTGPLLLFGGVLVFYALARATWGSRVGLVSVYALGLYLPFLGLVSNLHSEVLAVFFVCAAMLGLARYLRSGGLWWLALASAALAGLSLTRVAYGWVLTLVLVLFFLAWLLRRRRVDGRVAAAVGSALVLCLPWLAYTHAKTDRVLVWGNSGSLSLYWMASPYDGDHGDWHQAHLVFSEPALEPHRAFFASLRGRSLAEQNAEIEREAVRNIANHPDAYIGNVLANVSRMLVNAPYSRVDWQWNDLFYAVPNLLLLAVAVVTAVVLVPLRRALPPETAPFAVLGAVAFGLHALVASYPRMLAPIVPLVVWLATLAFVERGALTRVRRRRPLPSESA